MRAAEKEQPPVMPSLRALVDKAKKLYDANHIDNSDTGDIYGTHHAVDEAVSPVLDQGFNPYQLFEKLASEATSTPDEPYPQEEINLANFNTWQEFAHQLINSVVRIELLHIHPQLNLKRGKVYNSRLDSTW